MARYILKFFFILLVICVCSSPVFSADYYVSQSGAGLKDGSSPGNAWEGWSHINWDMTNDKGEGYVGAGDTLYIVGTVRALSFGISSQGTAEEARLTIASYPSNPGKLWQGWEISDIGWTGPDAYGAYHKSVSFPTTYGKAAEWTSDPWTDAVSLTTMPGVPDSTWTETGLYYCDSSNKIAYYKPSGGTPKGKTLTAWASTSRVFQISQKDYITISGLLMNNAVWISDSADYFTLEDCEVFCSGTLHTVGVGIGATADDEFDEGCDHAIIKGVYCHDCGNGIYTINQGNYNNGNSNYCLFENNYVANIHGTADSHAMGLQGGSNNIVQYNHLYNAGSGITCWNDTDQIMRDNIIRYNFVHHMGYFYQTDGANGRGIEFSGETADSDLTTGNLIYGNIVSDCYRDSDNDPDGVGIRIKNGIPTSGHSIKAFNNTVDNCFYNYYIMPTNYENYEVGAYLKNNISLNPKSGGYHVFVAAIGKTLQLEIDNNIYYPEATFYYQGSTSNNIDDWKALSGMDINSFAIDPNLDGNYAPETDSIALTNGDFLPFGHYEILVPSPLWPTEATTGNIKTVKQGNCGDGWVIGAISCKKPSPPSGLRTLK